MPAIGNGEHRSFKVIVTNSASQQVKSAGWPARLQDVENLSTRHLCVIFLDKEICFDKFNHNLR